MGGELAHVKDSPQGLSEAAVQFKFGINSEPNTYLRLVMLVI